MTRIMNLPMTKSFDHCVMTGLEHQLILSGSFAGKKGGEKADFAREFYIPPSYLKCLTLKRRTIRLTREINTNLFM